MLSTSCSASKLNPISTTTDPPVDPSPPLALRSSLLLPLLSLSLLADALHPRPSLSSCRSLTGPCLRGVYVLRLSPSAVFRSRRTPPCPWRAHLLIPALSLLFDTPTIVNLIGPPTSVQHERRSQSLPVAGRASNCQSGRFTSTIRGS